MNAPRADAGRGPRPERGSSRPQRGGRPAGPTPAKPLPYRVARWGKFWSLEPLFADPRSYLVAKGSLPPRLDDIVLAVPFHGDRCRIVEVLGRVDELKAVLRAMLYSEGLPQGTSPAVLEEAAAAGARAARPDHGRRDLTGVPTFTIDPDTARDFDDAISVERAGDGYQAHVHIADVSYFVDPGGAIEREARRRTSSVYLPLFAEPMLPAALSSDLCSLVPRRPRKGVTVEFGFAADGRRTSVQFYRSLISSDHRLTYGFVDGIIADGVEAPPAGGEAASAAAAVPDATTEADDELVARLRLARELAGVLRRRRAARGALTLGSFEPEYGFDRAGLLTSAVARPETPSHSLVEEFMLAANEAVAEFLLRKKGRALYRVHEPPAPASVRELLDQLAELGVPTPPFPTGQAVPAAALAEAYGRLSRLIAETSAREGRGRLAWSTLVLRSLKQARYSPSNLGHFGLASPAYAHFTSPIRRYPDLVTHRSLLEHLGEGGGELGEAELAAVAEDCSERERQISRLELRADDVALSFLLEEKLKEEGWEQDFEGE
ncbi:MAG: RNB domain-containing ribonuclease, partial [Actinomycetes bacterium]